MGGVSFWAGVVSCDGLLQSKALIGDPLRWSVDCLSTSSGVVLSWPFSKFERLSSLLLVVCGSASVGTLVTVFSFGFSSTAWGSVSGRNMLEFSGVGKKASSEIVMPIDPGVRPASSSEQAGGGDRSGVLEAKSSVCNTL